MSVSTLASLAMAIGAPLVYADQAYSIYRKQDARGFSHDVCAVLLMANITRCFFWLGERFEFALLLQSLLMIGAQLGLLYLCIRFKPVTKWSKSISSDGARVVFNANAADEEDESMLTSRQHEHNAIGSSSTQTDLMDLTQSEALRDQIDQDEEEEGYANKQPLLVTLGAMFRANSSRFTTNSSYDPLSCTDHNSYQSSHSNSNSLLPQPTTRSINTTSTSRLSSILSHLRSSSSKIPRPLHFWQWSDYNSYLVFLFLFFLFLSLLYMMLSKFSTFIATLGYVALGLESSLPIPQLVSNHKRKSLAGFRKSVLVGWLGGDSFKLVYFLLKRSPIQFSVCAILQLGVDLAILIQSRLYKEKTEKDEEEMRLKAQVKKGPGLSGREQGRSMQNEIEEDDFTDELSSGSRIKGKSRGKWEGNGSKIVNSKVEREDDQLLRHPNHVISIQADNDDDDDDDDEGDISNGRRK